MGLLIEGKWHDKWYDTDAHHGEFQREAAQLRNWVTENGEPGPNGEGGFPAESGRYHLYVSLACPWAHRALLFRHLKSLTEHIGVSVVSPDMGSHGWTFESHWPGVGDGLYKHKFLYELYLKNKPDYSGRVTVPVLWDTKSEGIVSNESSEIIRMLNTSFNALTGNNDDYYPEALREDINAVNQDIYDNVNNGVYRCGFATQQGAYEKAFDALFSCLERLESRLASSRYLVGAHITEADWRLFTTLVRFDAVYFGHFKCNLHRIEDFPNLSAYLRDLYQTPGVANTVHLDHIQRHYYYSHTQINPNRIVPKGPNLNWQRPHDREKLSE